jgi:glycopeptide antibiotics resistance protein
MSREFMRFENDMPKTSRPIQAIAIICLLIYLALLTKEIVFKKSSVTYYKKYFARQYKHYSVSQGWKKANTVPFHTINMYYKGYQHNNARASYNLLGNLFGFVPLGILLPLAFPWFNRWLRMFAAIAFVSLGFETTQLVTGLGIFDVDDLLLNSSGALAGYLLFRIASLVIKTPRKESNS